MDIERLCTDDDAVSEVIAVILLVAVVVILAAVVSTFVLSLGERTTVDTPQASFSFDYEDSTEHLVVRHGSGDRIDANTLAIRGKLTANSSGDDVGSGDVDKSDVRWLAIVDDTWAGTDGGASGEVDGQSAVSSGDFVEFPIGTDGRVSVVYVDEQRDVSATLGTWRGPDE
jgi:FlaG/FlaF family flagellin (archaellin)